MKKLSYKEIEELSKRIRNGDGDAFEELYMSTSKAQFYIANNYINNATLAQEAVQNMYISLYNHIDSIDGLAIIKWMNVTTINECKNLIRKEKFDKRVVFENFENKIIDTNSDPEVSYICKNRNEELNYALSKIGPDLKEIIIYRFINGLTIKEIAKITGFSTATVNRYIKTGLIKMKKIMKNLNSASLNFIFSPFWFNAFNKAVDSRMSDEMQRKVFSSIAKSLPAGVTSLATAKPKREIKKSNAAKYVAIGAGAITLAVVLTTPYYSMNMIKGDYVLKQKLQIQPIGISTIKNFDVYRNDEIIAKGNQDNNFTVNIDDNGIYEIVIENANGKKFKNSVKVTNIDIDGPDIEITKNDNKYEVKIADNGSGINYQSIQITDLSGALVQFACDENNNIISFESEAQGITLSAADNLGNIKTVNVIK